MVRIASVRLNGQVKCEFAYDDDDEVVVVVAGAGMKEKVVHVDPADEDLYLTPDDDESPYLASHRWSDITVSSSETTETRASGSGGSDDDGETYWRKHRGPLAKEAVREDANLEEDSGPGTSEWSEEDGPRG